MHAGFVKKSCAVLMAAGFLAAIGIPAAAAAQSANEHLSLADRVSRLEQQGQGGISLVNQVQQLQSEVQALRGQVEELQYRLQQFQNASRDQYVDLDSRLGRLEGRAPLAGTGGEAPVAPDGTVDLPAQTDAGQVAAGSNDDPAAGDPEADYDRAFAALRDGDFASASRLFNAFIAKFPSSRLTPNAYYWLGESYYGTQNYQVALETFQQLLRRFPGDAKAPGAMLKVGYSQYELNRLDDARATLEQVRSLYPDTREAQLAAGRLRALGLPGGG